MTPQISPIGIILALPFYWLVFLGMRRVWRRIGRNPKYWYFPYLGLIVLPIPFADELWIAWHFEQACKEAGVTVVRQVEAEGYLEITDPGRRYKNSPTIPERISKEGSTVDQWNKDMNGYRFKEQQLDDGSASRVELRADGIYGYVVDRPQARYHYRRAHKEVWAPAGFQMGRMEMQVIDAQTNEVLGREISYERFPGFVEGLWIRFLGSGQTICNRPLDDVGRTTPTGAAYSYVLIPKKPN